MEVRERSIIMLELSNGQIPFEEWYETLSPLLQRAVDARFTRLQVGNFGDHKSVGSGIYELRIPKGPGLRIYYGLRGSNLVILLCAGNKSSQSRDIKKAKKYWEKWLDEN